MVYWLSPVILSTSCRIDARKFPFDAQLCTLRFVPWSDDVNEVDLKLYKMGGLPVTNDSEIPHDDQFFIENGVWKFDSLSVQRDLVQYYGTYA